MQRGAGRVDEQVERGRPEDEVRRNGDWGPRPDDPGAPDQLRHVLPQRGDAVISTDGAKGHHAQRGC